MHQPQHRFKSLCVAIHPFPGPNKPLLLLTSVNGHHQPACSLLVVQLIHSICTDHIHLRCCHYSFCHRLCAAMGGFMSSAASRPADALQRIGGSVRLAMPARRKSSTSAPPPPPKPPSSSSASTLVVASSPTDEDGFNSSNNNNNYSSTYTEEEQPSTERPPAPLPEDAPPLAVPKHKSSSKHAEPEPPPPPPPPGGYLVFTHVSDGTLTCHFSETPVEGAIVFVCLFCFLVCVCVCVAHCALTHAKTE